MFLIGVADKHIDYSFGPFSCSKDGATPTTRYGYLYLSNLAKCNMYM